MITKEVEEALKIVREALEKQIPKKPIDSELTHDQWCPRCGRDVIGSEYYCRNCGQHLRWEGEEND